MAAEQSPASHPCNGPTLYSITSGLAIEPRTTVTLANRGGGVAVSPAMYAFAAAFGGGSSSTAVVPDM